MAAADKHRFLSCLFRDRKFNAHICAVTFDFPLRQNISRKTLPLGLSITASQSAEPAGSRPLVALAAREADFPLVPVCLCGLVVRHQALKALDQFFLIGDDIEKVPIMQKPPRNYRAALIRLTLF